ncbi:Os03g0782100 [Oryza sativa Japonica Group]|uniref:Os03g0782100 protein n=2 Tax=Oryza sativa subsp. japonica TaxID=39947 RepID=B9F609_ORYSJ|nr:hypothetical protein OsJ_12826 [Oryza sativa Japonica Group]BAS86689.1 Os03g0782100 [Oryza sativa Japonica Group]
MTQLGDPATRPEEDTIFIPTSYAIDEELREWNETAAVSWAARAPPSTGPQDVEQAFLDEFKLCRGDVAVSLHHPQAFLIKFQHRRHCEEAIAKGYVKRRGIEIHFIKWRSLQSALGVALMFRVWLCLDGVPMHAWAADIAERLIGHTCALEQIETDLVHPMESGNTRSIDLWAWTANPSTIPKRMWLGFTNRAKDQQLAPLLVAENPPEYWQRGVRHPVLFHLEEIHDYTAAIIDLEAQGSFQPTKRRLPLWTLEVLDGEQAPGRVFEDFPHHLQPPRSVHDRLGDHDREDELRGSRRPERGERGNRGDDGAHHGGRARVRDRSRRGCAACIEQDQDEEEDGRGDDDRDAPADHDDRARGGRRGRRGHNNDHPRANQNWRSRDRDDDDRDERGRDFGRGRGEQRAIDQDYRRERTRSPRQCDRGGHSRHGGRRHHAGATDVDNVTDPVHPEPHLAEISLPSRQQELHTEVCKFRLLHALHTSPFRT